MLNGRQGERKEIIMYEYVNHAEVEKYREFCSKTLTSLCASLKEYDIIAQPVLIGSGARNLVTRNGDSPFDLDYNLVISKMSSTYQQDLFQLKNRIMTLLNSQFSQTLFSDAKDSTSVVTSILHFRDTPQVKFSFDIGIVTKNSQGNFCRLIHQKKGYPHGTFTWCEIPTSAKVGEKASAIKKAGKWDDVRQRYLKLKNQYLSTGDRNHPSFVVYVESINEAYEAMQKKAQPTTKKATAKVAQKNAAKSTPVQTSSKNTSTKATVSKKAPKSTSQKKQSKASAEKAARDARANQLNPNNKAYIGNKNKKKK